MSLLNSLRDSIPAPASWRRHADVVCAVIVAVCAFAFCYGSVAASLVSQWRDNDIYAHGFLIPGISAYLAWTRRAQLASRQIRPSYAAGVLALLASLAIFVVAERASIAVVAQLTIVTTVAALVLLSLGFSGLATLALPIGYLVFMIPVWETITERLHHPSQIVAARIGAFLLNVVGVPVHRDGVQLVLPNIALEVARECSGVNYLIAILAVGIPLAWLGLRGISRFVLIAGAVAIAILANGVRVGVIGLLAYGGTTSDPHGPWHILQGLAVASVGYLALIAGYSWLKRVGGAAQEVESGAASPVFWRPRGLHVSLAAGAVVLVIAGTQVRASADNAVPLHAGLDTLPASIGDWSQAPIGPFQRSFINADQRLTRRYLTNAASVTLHVEYCESQRQGKELVSYRTREDLERDSNPVSIAIGGTELKVMERVDSIEGNSVLLTYWFDQSGVTSTNRFRVKLQTAMDSLLNNRTNGALVVVATAVEPTEDVEAARTRRNAFVRAAWPELQTVMTGKNR
jgi:EpsI family protein